MVIMETKDQDGDNSDLILPSRGLLGESRSPRDLAHGCSNLGFFRSADESHEQQLEKAAAIATQSVAIQLVA
jgi:hypothetical protein